MFSWGPCSRLGHSDLRTSGLTFYGYGWSWWAADGRCGWWVLPGCGVAHEAAPAAANVVGGGGPWSWWTRHCGPSTAPTRPLSLGSKE
jgi:hypothetical protein